jgi:hypothetical protein
MVIKSMSRKTMSFFQLIEYVARDGRAEGSPVLHNLNADSHDLIKVNKAFMQNARHCPPRKNGAILYHEILSLSPEDKPHATPEILADLAEHYLSLRAPGAMAFGMVHFDKNPHIHLIISANLRGQAKKLRLSKNEFSRVKREVEVYQKEKYPELSQSIVFDGGKKNEREVKQKTVSGTLVRKPSELERVKQLKNQGRGEPTRKAALRDKVLNALVASYSEEAFVASLEHHGITVYKRNGHLAGIISNNKKYRFRTLGLEEDFHTAGKRWERFPERKKTLGDIVSEKARRFLRGYGFARDLMEVLKPGKGEGMRQQKEVRRHRRLPDGPERER